MTNNVKLLHKQNKGYKLTLLEALGMKKKIKKDPVLNRINEQVELNIIQFLNPNQNVEMLVVRQPKQDVCL